MRHEVALWGGVAAYFGTIAVVYAGVGGDRVGVVVLIAAAAFGGLVAGWSWRWSRTHAVMASESDDADVADDAGDVGVVADASLRPLGIGAGITIAALGVPLGSWMVATGVALLASQVGLLVRDRDG